MFPDALPVKAVRKCLYGDHKFVSSSAAERVCPKCRRKHTKLVEKYGGIMTFETTPQMHVHMESVMERDNNRTSLTRERINALLDGDLSLDDSFIYEEIKPKKKNKTTARGTKKPRAVFLLAEILKDQSNVKTKKIKFTIW